MTDVFAPQTPELDNLYVQAFDEDGTAIWGQVQNNQIAYTGIFGNGSTSSTLNSISLGTHTFTLDVDDGSIELDYTVQCLSEDDTQCWMYGVVTGLNRLATPVQITVSVFTTSPLVNTTENWQIQTVAGPFQGVPASQALGFSTDSFAVPSAGDTLNLTIDLGKAFRSGDVVYVYAVQDSTAYAVASVVSYDPATGAIQLFVLRAGGTGTFAIWACSLQDIAGPDAALKGYSSTTVTLAAGDKTFTTQSGKFMPIGGSVFVQAVDDATVRGWGQVKVYTGTTLILTFTASGIFGSGAHSVWALTLVDGAPPGIPLNQLNGLRVSLSGTTLTVTAGSIRDSTNTYDLVLPSTITKDTTAVFAAGSGNGSQILSANLVGTVTASGGGGQTITGSSTTFTSSLSSTIQPTNALPPADYTARGGSAPLTNRIYSTALLMNTAAENAVQTITNNTAMLVAGVVSPLVTGVTYKRGGYYLAGFGNGYGVLLLRNDTTGAIDVGTYSLYPGTTPDLPSGWSVYGAIAIFTSTAGPIYYIQQWSGTALSQISPMTTEGDLIYQNSGLPSRLAVGSSTQVLTSNGTDPTWAQVSGSQIVSSAALAGSPTTTTQTANDNSTKIATTAFVSTAAGIQTVASASMPSANSVTVAIPAGSRNIVISWSGVSFDTATQSLLIQVSTDNGSTYDTTAANYAGGILFYDGASSPALNAVASLSSTGNLTAAQTESGTVVISGYGTAAFKPYIGTRQTSIPTTRGSSGYYNSTLAITNIRLINNGAGTVKFDAGSYVICVT